MEGWLDLPRPVSSVIYQSGNLSRFYGWAASTLLKLPRFLSLSHLSSLHLPPADEHHQQRRHSRLQPYWNLLPAACRSVPAASPIDSSRLGKIDPPVAPPSPSTHGKPGEHVVFLVPDLSVVPLAVHGAVGLRGSGHQHQGAAAWRPVEAALRAALSQVVPQVRRPFSVDVSGSFRVGMSENACDFLTPLVAFKVLHHQGQLPALLRREREEELRGQQLLQHPPEGEAPPGSAEVRETSFSPELSRLCWRLRASSRWEGVW